MPLETPLFGRYLGEEKRLVFAPAKEYFWLVGTCLGGGALGAIAFRVAQNSFMMLVSLAVMFAGFWAALSLQWIGFNLRERIYTRREGPGLFPRTTRGSLDELEAVFLLSELHPLLGQQVTYRLVLQWHGLKQPSMILQQDHRSIPGGAPINYGGKALLAHGMRVARSLGVPFVDHSHVSTANPVPLR